MSWSRSWSGVARRRTTRTAAEATARRRSHRGVKRPLGARPGPPGKVRIIGGRWRGTTLPLAAHGGLRPSSSRTRETLFNWLTPYLPGARCLDLFAGTGVLGFEAVSRGARAADLVEADQRLCVQLTAARTRLAAAAVTVHHAEAFEWLRRTPQAYDIVFLDPPFNAGLVPRALATLVAGWLAPRALVYVEQERSRQGAYPGWQIVRQGATREVDYALVTYAG